MRRTRSLVFLSFLALPFVLFSWLVPFLTEQTIGNDYTRFPTRQQQELLFSVRMGSFPLFVPGFAGGQTASALTLGQVYHPLTYLAALSPGYWQGHALEWNTFWRLLSLGLTHYVLFRLLRGFGLGVLMAGVVSGAAVYNLRMLDWFRYGSSLEAYTASLLASAGAFWCLLTPGRWLPRFGLVAATYCLTVSGHPQVMYYGMLGLGTSVLLAPWFCGALDLHRPNWPGALRYYARTGGMILAGILLGMAYVVPFVFEFLADNSQRVGRDYEWANSLPDSLEGTFHNFFLPLRASLVGAFGGTPLFLVAALTPVVVLVRKRPPAVVWVVWGLCVLAFLHMQGDRTPVHEAFWTHLPFAGSFRIAGRISSLLPFWFALLLVWQLRQGVSARNGTPAKWWRSPPGVCITTALALTAVYPTLPARLLGEPLWTPAVPEWTHTWTWALALVSLVALGATWRALATGSRHPQLPAAAFVVTSLILMALCLRFGTWTESRAPTPTFAELRAEKRRSLEFTGDPGNGLYPASLVEQLRNRPHEPFLARLFEEQVAVADTAEAYERLSECRDPWTAFVEMHTGGPDATSDEEGDASARDGPTLTIAGSSIELVYSSFNRITFRVQAKVPSFLGLAYPYSKRWKATIDGAPARVYRANGAYHGVRVPSGTSTLDFRYHSKAAYAGMVVSLVAALVLGFLCSRTVPPGWPRRATLLAPIAAGLGVFGWWATSLYSGQDLETAYAWQAPGARSSEVNLAYGRHSWVSSQPGPQFVHVLGGHCAVDGMIETGTGALTRKDEYPFWVVDLARPTRIERVVIHEGDEELVRRFRLLGYREFNVRPLLVQISMDYETWETVHAFQRPPRGQPLRATLSPPRPARFVRILGRDTRLALTEVEIH